MTGIYYSDLFVINGCGCLVMGYGKSQTCRHYTGDGTIEICSDSIRLENCGGVLFGYADPAMGLLPFDKTKAQNTQIKYLVRMLDKEETQKMGSSITEVSKEEFSSWCDFNVTFGVHNPSERREEFKGLINDVDLICILVPWCEDMEKKGRLIQDYIK